MATTPPLPPPDSSGIRIGDVGGSVNFSALGDIVGGDKITTITTTIQISVEAITQRPLITASPYRGLDRFEDRDKDLFFGRDQLIKSLLTQLSASNVLLVLGASGSGKSSVVRAGLLPQLSQLIGARFRYFTLVPDVNPFESLRSAVQGAGFSQAQTRELAEAKPETPAKLIQTLQRSGDQWLFFVDQFEEIFTVGDEKLRASFIAALLQIARDSNSSAKLVLAMRADFLDRFSPFPEFAKILEKNIHLVADMHADELRQAIEQPAARHGVVFEQGLVEEIIKDVQGQAGSLPLLQYTLDLLWQEEAREDALADRHLNARAYRELGGVRGALQKRADEIYASFGDGSDAKAATPKQEIVRQVFLRLVDLAGEGSNDAAWRPVRRRALMTMFANAQEQEILQALINQKLLVSNREGDDATVEVAHEALFTSWGRLKNWIEAGKQVIFARNRLADDARRWQRRQREGDADADEELLAGSRLSQALDMRVRSDFNTVVGGLDETEAQFLDASAAARDRRRQEEQARQQRELAQAQALAAEQKKRGDDQAKAAKRQRLLTSVMIALSLLAGLAAVFAWTKRNEANAGREAAEKATSSGLGTQATILAERPGKEFEALTVGIKAVLPSLQKRRQPEEAATRGLWNAIIAVRYSLPLRGHSEGVTSAAFSPDSSCVITAAKDGMRLWEAVNGRLLATAKHTEHIFVRNIAGPSAFSPDSNRLVVITDNAGQSSAQILDAKNGQLIKTIGGELGETGTVQFSPDGKRVLTTRGVSDATGQLWEVETGNALNVTLRRNGQTAIGTFTCAAFSLDGTRIVTGNQDECLHLWNAENGEMLATFHAGRKFASVTYSPDGRLFLATSNSGTMSLWKARPVANNSPAQGDTLQSIPGFYSSPIAFAPSGAFSKDGDLLVVANSALVDIWKTQMGDPVTSFHIKNLFGELNSTVLSPIKDSVILTTGLDQTARLWEWKENNQDKTADWTLRTTLEGHTKKVTFAGFSPDASRIVTVSEDGTARIWNPGIRSQTGGVEEKDPSRLISIACEFLRFQPEFEVIRNDCQPFLNSR